MKSLAPKELLIDGVDKSLKPIGLKYDRTPGEPRKLSGSGEYGPVSIYRAPGEPRKLSGSKSMALFLWQL